MYICAFCVYIYTFVYICLCVACIRKGRLRCRFAPFASSTTAAFTVALYQIHYQVAKQAY